MYLINGDHTQWRTISPVSIPSPKTLSGLARTEACSFCGRSCQPLAWIQASERCQLRFFSELRVFSHLHLGLKTSINLTDLMNGEWMIDDEWHVKIVVKQALWNWDLLKTPCIFSCKGTMSVLCVQVTGGVAILTWDDRGQDCVGDNVLDAFSGWSSGSYYGPTGDYINLYNNARIH